MTQVIFEIAKAIILEAIASKLDRLGLKVLPYSKKEFGGDAYDSSHIIFIGQFPHSVALQLTASYMNSLSGIEG